jgi:DHA1 family multidrug resistance protein-like MFS transporter
MLGVLGYGITMVMFGLATQLWMLFGARVLSGVLSSATTPTSMAYISDNTSEEERGAGMGTLGAAMGLGMILGPGLGGWLSGDSLSMPFFIAAGLCLFTVLLIYFLLPESQSEGSGLQAGELAGLFLVREFWQALFSPIGVLMFMAFLARVGLTIFYGIFGLYVLNRLNYGAAQVGGILTVIGLVSAIAQGIVTGPFTKRLGEVRVIKTALLMSVVGFLLMPSGKNYWTVLLTTGFFILAISLLTPAVIALASKQSSITQGAAMGLCNSAMSLGTIVGPIWAGIAFDLDINFPYISGAVFLFVGFLVCLAMVQ